MQELTERFEEFMKDKEYREDGKQLFEITVEKAVNKSGDGQSPEINGNEKSKRKKGS